MDLDISRVFSNTVAMVKGRFGPLAAMWLLFFVLQLVLFGGFGAAMGLGATAGAAFADPTALGGGMILGVFLLYIVYFLIYCAQSCAMSALASPLLEASFGDSLSKGFRGSLTYLGVFVLLFIAYFVIALAVGLLVGLVAFAGEAIGGVLGVVMVIAAIPVAIFLMCRLSVISPVIAVDRIFNPIRALSRTWAVTRGNVLKIFLVLLIFGVAALAIFGLLFAMFFGSITAMSTGSAPPSGGTLAVMGIVFIVVSIAFALFSAALISSLHAEMSDVGEGDLSETFG